MGSTLYFRYIGQSRLLFFFWISLMILTHYQQFAWRHKQRLAGCHEHYTPYHRNNARRAKTAEMHVEAWLAHDIILDSNFLYKYNV
ncbi:hypothetical protein BJY01DRAFT_172120 [Aspergillus pseudoustus]|uniref:Secreted protein n=1 Tax=Aspergillus pseudoustus TaxID=1810923 RepID=A0ABR4KWP0_9EURO